MSNTVIESHLREQSYESLLKNGALDDLRYISDYISYVKKLHNKDIIGSLPKEVQDILTKIDTEYRAKYDEE